MSKTFFNPSLRGVDCLMTARTLKYNNMNREGIIIAGIEGKV